MGKAIYGMIVGLTTLTLVSCDNVTISSLGVEDADIYREHELIYNADTETTYMRTRLTTGVFGPTIRLDRGALYFEGQLMETTQSSELGGSFNKRIEYFAQIEVDPTQRYFDVEYYSDSGKLTIDTLTLSDRVDIVYPMDGESYAYDQTLPVIYDAELQYGESMALYMGNPNTNWTSPFEIWWNFSGDFSQQKTYKLSADLGFGSEKVIRLARQKKPSFASEWCGDFNCLSPKTVYLSESVHIKLD